MFGIKVAERNSHLRLGGFSCSAFLQKVLAQKTMDVWNHVENHVENHVARQLCVEKILTGALFVGHVKTDLDSIAGAIGGACLWQGTATRAEKELNGEIMYALKWAGPGVEHGGTGWKVDSFSAVGRRSPSTESYFHGRLSSCGLDILLEHLS